jgi:predicted sulfurtransferase
MRLTCDTCRRYDTISQIVYGENSMGYFCGRCNEKRTKKERQVQQARRAYHDKRRLEQERRQQYRKVA